MRPNALPPTLLRCPGWDKQAHELPATLEYFYRSARDGFTPYCKQCTREYAREARRKWNEERARRKAAHEAAI